MAAWTAFSTGTSALSVLVAVFTFMAGGPAAVAVATVLRVLPGGLLGPFAATLATSRRPQLHLAIGIGARGLVAVASIIAVLGGASVGVVLALVATDSLVSAAVKPLHGALVVRLADLVEEAETANASTSSLRSASGLAGPALAGLAIGAVGIGWAFAVPAVAFAAGAAVALRIRVPHANNQPESPRPSPRGWARAQLIAVGAGFRGIVKSRPAAAATALFVLNTTLDSIWFVAAVSVAGELGLGESGITLIMTICGVGGLLGALATLSIVGRRGLPRVAAGAMLGWAVTLAAIGVTHLPVLGLALAAGLGAAGAVAYAITPTLVQRSVAPATMVPAAASLQSLPLVGVGAGSAIAALLINSLGVTTTLAIVAGATVLITAVTWPQLRRADVLSADDTAKLAVIRASSVLAPLPALALEQLARAATRVAAPAGAEVIRQGDPGDRFYMIASGTADVSVDGRPVATLGPGDSFGEIALLHDVPRLITVTAREDLDLVVVDRAEFLDALSSDPGAVGPVGGIAGARAATPPVEDQLVELDRDVALGGRSLTQLLAAQPPLATIGADELRALANSARVVAAPDGALVIREGDYGEAYYVILDGAAQVLRGENPVSDLGPGDGFGEQAILRDVPRIATVRAVGDTTLVAVDRGAFQRALRVG